MNRVCCYMSSFITAVEHDVVGCSAKSLSIDPHTAKCLEIKLTLGVETGPVYGYHIQSSSARMHNV